MKLKYPLSFYCFILITFLFPIIPKNISVIFNFLPTRLTLLYFLFLIIFIELKLKKIKFKNESPKVFYITYILIILSMLLAFFISVNKVLYFYTFFKFLSYGLLVYVLTRYPFNKKQLNILTNTLMFSALIIIFYGLLSYLLGINLNVAGIYKYPGSLGRISSTFFLPNYYAIFLLSIIALSYYKMFYSEKIILRLFYLLVILLSIVSVLLTFTRATYALLLFMLFFMFLTSLFRKGNRLKLFFGMPLLFLIMFLYVIPGTKYVYSSTLIHAFPQNLSVNLLEFSNKYLYTKIDLALFLEKKHYEENDEFVYDDNYEVITDASVKSRTRFKSQVKRVIDDYPITGIGLGNYEKFIMSNENKYLLNGEILGYPHNSILHLQAEAGVFSILLIYLIIFSFLFWSIIKYILTKNIGYTSIMILWTSILVLTSYESLFYDSQLFPLLIIVTVLIINKMRIKKPITNKKIMFIASAGGHLTQIMHLNSLFDKYKHIIITEKNEISLNMKNDYNVKFLPYISRNQKTIYLFNLIWSIKKSFYYFIKFNPDVIISTGANSTAAMCCFGKIFNKEVIFIESFAKNDSPTITGKWIYKLGVYSTFVVQWENMKKFYPKAEYWGWIY